MWVHRYSIMKIKYRCRLIISQLTCNRRLTTVTQTSHPPMKTSSVASALYHARVQIPVHKFAVDCNGRWEVAHLWQTCQGLYPSGQRFFYLEKNQPVLTDFIARHAGNSCKDAISLQMLGRCRLHNIMIKIIIKSRNAFLVPLISVGDASLLQAHFTRLVVIVTKELWCQQPKFHQQVD